PSPHTVSSGFDKIYDPRMTRTDRDSKFYADVLAARIFTGSASSCAPSRRTRAREDHPARVARDRVSGLPRRRAAAAGGGAEPAVHGEPFRRDAPRERKLAARVRVPSLGRRLSRPG